MSTKQDTGSSTGNDLHSLYRFFDADGSLLYVGRTCSPHRRFREHRHDKSWWLEVARIEIQHLESHAELARAERQAIERERPEYNVTYGTAPRTPGGARRRRECYSDKAWSESIVGKYFTTGTRHFGSFGYVVARAGGGKMWVNYIGDTQPTKPGIKLTSVRWMKDWKYADTPEGAVS